MKILIEVEEGCVTNVWCSEPDGATVIIRDMDEITSGCDDIYDPLLEELGVAELRTPHFVIY